ncbi:hypothetical protein EW093_11065 [Thiospirochaeta perfilievii]|uniref:Uncharacterized protein n=1 Tax=Thiospirochaeta perfilievii TaxID=252967 RepID=A0A5C1QD02_9SPIO|nr:hypothetical protein [Thiospirochaeta perfilievii]QEN05228.1 hypothetical protein EW093_11065 [Thiospirochaeta perfilievii]
MNQKERAINLGLKIKSLKGNLSVSKAVISDLEIEIKEAIIDDGDRIRLLELYKNVVEDLKQIVSPSAQRKGYFNQRIEDILRKIKESKNYKMADDNEGLIIALEEELKKDNILKKEHRAAIKNRLETVGEKHRARVGFFLKKNYDNLYREIKNECDCDNPFHVSVVVKKYNEVVKLKPLFNDDRHSIQALLDTNWQKSSSDIKEQKRRERGLDE